MDTIGKKLWVIPGGFIPEESHGHEPDFVSSDQMAILNTTDQEAELEITIYFEDKGPQGPYPLQVRAGRVRKVRFNDLIDPQAIPLNKEYAAVISSNVPVVVQFSRLDSSHRYKAISSTIAFSNGQTEGWFK